jgi:peptide/nickel transport system permease protein
VVTALAGISFLGLGVQPPTPDWGDMLARARTHLLTAPWLMLAPGAAVTAAVLGCNLLGDALRDALGRAAARG